MTEALSLHTRREIVEFDRAVLSALCREHGMRTESFLTGRLNALGRALDRAETARAMGDTITLDARCATIEALAKRIGMRTMVLAARATRDAVAADDGPAIAACTARMVRLGCPESMCTWTVRRGTVA